MTGTIILMPGHALLADWRAVADGAAVRLDPSAMPAAGEGARAADAIIAKGLPVYGINTGFGTLAGVISCRTALQPSSEISCFRMQPGQANLRAWQPPGL